MDGTTPHRNAETLIWFRQERGGEWGAGKRVGGGAVEVEQTKKTCCAVFSSAARPRARACEQFVTPHYLFAIHRVRLALVPAGMPSPTAVRAEQRKGGAVINKHRWWGGRGPAFQNCSVWTVGFLVACIVGRRQEWLRDSRIIEKPTRIPTSSTIGATAPAAGVHKQINKSNTKLGETGVQASNTSRTPLLFISAWRETSPAWSEMRRAAFAKHEREFEQKTRPSRRRASFFSSAGQQRNEHSLKVRDHQGGSSFVFFFFTLIDGI